MNNKYEIDKLIKNKNYDINTLLNIDKYISFLKEYLFIDKNELLIIIDLTIKNKYNKILTSNKDYNKYNSYYKKRFIKMFMYQYNNNIKFLKKYIKIDKRNFDNLTNHLNNKKRIYSYFEEINNTNISFYLPIILKLEYPNS